MNLPKENITKDFTYQEMACKCGKCESKIDETMVMKLQHIRDELRRPIVINSAYRCPAYNAEIGGAEDSYHMKGLAVDVSIERFTERQLYSFLVFALGNGFKGIGISKKFIHLDLRDKNQSIWFYEGG